MFDVGLITEILLQIDEAIGIVRDRFSAIGSPDDFLNSPEGLEKLDSICMKHIAIGESVKNIDKHTESSLPPQISRNRLEGREGSARHYLSP